jgi:glycosyltransferase involved in cell wall biosynthesis
MLLSIVVPVYNEGANLERCWRTLAAVLERTAESFEVLMVDDGSVDRSWDTLRALADEAGAGGRLRGLRLSRNFGKEAAILAGLRMAQGDAVIVMDADLQHPPELIPRMLELWGGGRVAVVEAVKRRRQPESWPLRLGARLYYRLFILASGIDLRGSSDFKLLDRRVVEQYISLPEAGRFFRGLTAWLGFPSLAVEFDPPRRQAGRSRWGLGALFQMARRTVISFSSLPLRLVTWLGAFGLLFSLVLTLQTLWYHWQGLAEEGFPTVILLILGMGSMILLGLGLIGEYVAEIYIEVKRRPSYIVSDSTGEPPVK